GRRRLLDRIASRAKFPIAPNILDWLATNLRSGRQLEGAVRELHQLQRMHKKPLRLADVETHFGSAANDNDISIDRIVAEVCDRFHVMTKQLQAARRDHHVMLPRQVSMYLARQLTSLSFDRIGTYFGGRDHKTVQHACV